MVNKSESAGQSIAKFVTVKEPRALLALSDSQTVPVKTSPGLIPADRQNSFIGNSIEAGILLGA